MNDIEIFNLIKNQEYEKIYKLINSNKNIDLDIRDNNYNYFINYIVNLNQYDILKLIFENQSNIRIDILDIDGRTILYNCIRYNYIKILKLLLDYNKKNIGLSIIEFKDKLGYTSLHYSIIFNNFEAFKILLDYNANPYSVSNEYINAFIYCLIYIRNNMFDYLLEKEYNINFLTNNNETLLQVALTYNNIYIINKLLKYNINLNNTNNNFGLAFIHQVIINNYYEIFLKILILNININIADFYGNTILHYIFLYKRIKYLKPLFDNYINIIKFNISNINGDCPLHILLENNLEDLIDEQILCNIIMETDLDLQNNNGITCLTLLINKNLYKDKKIKDLLIIKPLNFFINDIIINDDILNILIESYYNQLINNKDKLIIEWEIWCSNNLYKKLIKVSDKIPKSLNNNNKSSSENVCKNKIKEIIIKEKRSFPKVLNFNLNLDNGIFTNYCSYTGMPIDILFGLLLLNNDFKSIGLNLILDYPLTINDTLEKYYQKINLDYPYKLDFSNIEIIWSYQKIFFPSFFDEEITKQLKISKYIVIPIGIEISIGSHANILLWDVEQNTLERFEPNGSNYPMNLNYNPSLLDSLIESKFKLFNSDIKYIPPFNFLPHIGFQMLEILETARQKKIGDANGFCGVWCIWWVYQRLLNRNVNLYILPNQLIKIIKLENLSFKSIIRNFSKKITNFRDTFLKKYNLDINDWIVSNYDDELLHKLEIDILNYKI
jgi:ankyrin repeat protein